MDSPLTHYMRGSLESPHKFCQGAESLNAVMGLLEKLFISLRFGFCKTYLKCWNLRLGTEKNKGHFTKKIYELFCREFFLRNVTVPTKYMWLSMLKKLKAMHCQMCRQFFLFNKSENHGTPAKKNNPFMSFQL